ncbi:MAG TPA: HD domain-containing phosphohydrolase [Sedimentisphaerales bacterium]|nr:HD domain-containing phosphohydrolase [Sedimentisphaerales bacterium]
MSTTASKTKSLTAAQMEQLAAFAARLAGLGNSAFVCNVEGKPLIQQPQHIAIDREKIAELAHRAIAEECKTVITSENMSAVCLCRDGEAMASLVAQTGCSGQQPAGKASEFLSSMLEVFAEGFNSVTKAEEQVELVSNELARTYEEMMLLHKMTTNMKLTESDCNYLQMACDSLTELVSVEGIAILLEKGAESEKRMVLSAGAGVIKLDSRWMDVLMARLEYELGSGKDALLDSDEYSRFRHEWPTWVRSIMAVPLYRKERVIGMMVAVNRLDKADFDSIDVKLFTSVANECAVFIENGRLFTDLKELFIGSMKSLTSSIDAKDQYTRGHSERVAFISRWIAERLAAQGSLHAEQVHRIYLAGLLHDVGKIGIAESVLRKNGPLTDMERKQIQAHPAIGAGILSEIKQMRDIIPGVLGHHEWHNGKGYPNGLQGDEIPLIGKIVMIADSFDAMTSKRTYRDAMSIPAALGEMRAKSGQQFDPELTKLFIESDVQQLWWIIQDGMVEHYYDGSFSAYGIEAVGTLII